MNEGDLVRFTGWIEGDEEISGLDDEPLEIGDTGIVVEVSDLVAYQYPYTVKFFRVVGERSMAPEELELV